MTSVESREIWTKMKFWGRGGVCGCIPLKKLRALKAFGVSTKEVGAKAGKALMYFALCIKQWFHILFSRERHLNSFYKFYICENHFHLIKNLSETVNLKKDARARLRKIMTKISESVKSHLNCHNDDYACHIADIIMLILTFMPKKGDDARSDDKKWRCRRVYCLGQQSDSR